MAVCAAVPHEVTMVETRTSSGLLVTARFRSFVTGGDGCLEGYGAMEGGGAGVVDAATAVVARIAICGNG